MDSSYVFTPMDKSYLYQTLPERLHHFAEVSPDKLAFVFYSVEGERTSVTCSELYRKSLQFARGLIKMGVGKGHVVAVGLPNIIEWLVCHFGVIMVGGIALGFKFERKDGADVLHSISKSENCKAVIFETSPYDNNYEIIKKIAEGTDQQGYIKRSPDDSLLFAIHCGKNNLKDFPFTYNNVLSLGMDQDDIDLPRLDPDDTCMILLTSGTTGFSKLVPWSHFRILSVPESGRNMTNIAHNDVFFDPQSFNHVGGYALVFEYLNVGCTCVTVDNLYRAESVEAMSELIAQSINTEKCNKALIVGPCLHFLASGNLELGRMFPVRTIYTGGYPLQRSVGKALGKVTRRILVLYGSTEVGFTTSKEITDCACLQDYQCGFPYRGNEIKIVNESNIICPRGIIGLIHSRGRIPFTGYLNEVEKNRKVVTNGQWYNTGDIGYITKTGELFVMGRESELVQVGGKNISPFMIESLIREHPDVESVAVIPVPDDVTFHKLCACIVRKSYSSVLWPEIENFLREELNAKKTINEAIPNYQLFLESLPINENGKIKRKELTEMAMTFIQQL